MRAQVDSMVKNCDHFIPDSVLYFLRHCALLMVNASLWEGEPKQADYKQGLHKEAD